MLGGTVYANSGSFPLGKTPNNAISAFQMLEKIMAEYNMQDVVSVRSSLLEKHSFPAGSTLASFFNDNGLTVMFDFPEIGNRKINQPIFFATVGDLLDFVTEILGYKVSVRGRGIYIISECWEDIYSVPPEAGRFLIPKAFITLMDHKKASVRYLPEVGRIYFYDDKKGHQRLSDYVRAISEVLRREEYLWHRVPVVGQYGHNYGPAYIVRQKHDTEHTVSEVVSKQNYNDNDDEDF